MEEVIQNVLMLNEDAPRTQNKETKAGLYIELKGYDDKLAKGWDTAQMLYDLLDKYGIGNIADASTNIPVIIQSFDKNGLEKMATLTDLPLLQLCHSSDKGKYDWDDITTYAHGVGVPSSWIMSSTENVWDIV